MQKKEHCHIALLLGSICELDPVHEPGFRDSLALLRDFKAVIVELKKRSWGFCDPNPALFGTTEESDEVASSVIWFKRALGCDVQGWRKTGKKVEIVRSFTDGENEREILWDSEKCDVEVGKADEDVVMGED